MVGLGGTHPPPPPTSYVTSQLPKGSERYYMTGNSSNKQVLYHYASYQTEAISLIIHDFHISSLIWKVALNHVM